VNSIRTGEPSSLHCRISSLMSEVDSASRELRAFLMEHGLSANAFEVELIARECLNNAIIHGNQSDSRREVAMELRLGRKWISLRIEDEGAGFHRRKSGKPGCSDLAAVGGRGLSIACMYADRIAFNRRGNRISIWLKKAAKEQK
jgi:serine/threonine-protein kinase RsbW